MTHANEQLDQLAQSYLDNAVLFGQISLEGIEHLTQFGLALSKHHLELQQQAWEAIAQTEGPVQAISQISKFAEQSWQEALTQSETVYKILANTHDRLTDVVNKSSNTLQEAAHLVMDQMVQ